MPLELRRIPRRAASCAIAMCPQRLSQESHSRNHATPYSYKLAAHASLGASLQDCARGRFSARLASQRVAVPKLARASCCCAHAMLLGRCGGARSFDCNSAEVFARHARSCSRSHTQWHSPSSMSHLGPRSLNSGVASPGNCAAHMASMRGKAWKVDAQDWRDMSSPLEIGPGPLSHNSSGLRCGTCWHRGRPGIALRINHR